MLKLSFNTKYEIIKNYLDCTIVINFLYSTKTSISISLLLYQIKYKILLIIQQLNLHIILSKVIIC